MGSLTESMRAPFAKGAGLQTGVSTAGAIDNNYAQRWKSADGLTEIEGVHVDAFNNLLLGEEVQTPMRRTITFNLSTAASLNTQHFMIIPAACRLVGISEIHATAESTAATLTTRIVKLTGTQAVAAGTSLMSGTFNMKATANTVQNATLTTVNTAESPILNLAAGDRLGIIYSTVTTELAGVAITITVAPAGTGHWVMYNMLANGDLVDQAIFLANRDFIITGAYEVHSTLGTNGSAVNVQLTKDVSTNAPGAGTDILTNSTNAGFNLKAAINTVQTGTLTATAATLRLAPGDRISIDFAGTLTAVAGLVIVVVLQPIGGRRKDITFALSKNANLVDQVIFVADRGYKILDAAAVWSVASATGNIQLTRDTGTDAPGAGTDLILLDTSAGWQSDATANTPEVATWKDTRFNYLLAGDRLALDFAVGASLAGLVVAIGLEPA